MMKPTTERKTLLGTLIPETAPEKWPTLDEMPETDTRDLERAAQYQSTVDADFESC